MGQIVEDKNETSNYAGTFQRCVIGVANSPPRVVTNVRFWRQSGHQLGQRHHWQDAG
jgi:hypothetical protein